MSDAQSLERENRRLQAVVFACWRAMHTAAVMLEEGNPRSEVAAHLERAANGAAAAQPAGDGR